MRWVIQGNTKSKDSGDRQKWGWKLLSRVQSSRLRDRTWVSQIGGRFFIIWATREADNSGSNHGYSCSLCLGSYLISLLHLEESKRNLRKLSAHLLICLPLWQYTLLFCYPYWWTFHALVKGQFFPKCIRFRTILLSQGLSPASLMLPFQLELSQHYYKIWLLLLPLRTQQNSSQFHFPTQVHPQRSPLFFTDKFSQALLILILLKFSLAILFSKGFSS